MTDGTSPDQDPAATNIDPLLDDDAELDPDEVAPPGETKAEKRERLTRMAIRKRDAERRKKALDARVLGMTWRQVAEVAGYSGPGPAWRAVKEELAKIPRESAKELMQVELETLSVAQTAIIAQVRRGAPDAVASLLKIMDMRAKLTGLYKADLDDSSDDVRAALLGFLAGAKATHEAQVAREAGDDGEQADGEEAA